MLTKLRSAENMNPTASTQAWLAKLFFSISDIFGQKKVMTSDPDDNLFSFLEFSGLIKTFSPQARRMLHPVCMTKWIEKASDSNVQTNFI